MYREINTTRKSMIMCGLITDADRIWKIEQLTKDFEQIATQNMNYFNEL